MLHRSGSPQNTVGDQFGGDHEVEGRYDPEKLLSGLQRFDRGLVHEKQEQISAKTQIKQAQRQT